MNNLSLEDEYLIVMFDCNVCRTLTCRTLENTLSNITIEHYNQTHYQTLQSNIKIKHNKKERVSGWSKNISEKY